MREGVVILWQVSNSGDPRAEPGQVQALRLRLLGHMAVDDSRGRSLLPRTRKSRALLAVLAMASPKPVLRAHLAGLLWSRREKEQARASLRQSVHELQDALGSAWSGLFVTDRHHLTLRGKGLDIDAQALLQPSVMSAELLERFDAILLEDLSGLDPAFDRWLEDERARLARVGRSVGESVLAKCTDPSQAIEIAERLLLIDRTHEGAWRTLIRGHADRGDFGNALGSYDRCRGVLAEAGTGQPSRETEDLIGRLRAESIDKGPSVTAAALAEPPAPLTGRPAGGGPTWRDRSTLRLRVTPLRTIGEDRGDGLGVGLAEEIAAGLSRFRWISCVPAVWPGASGGGNGIPVAADADLVLEGTVQHAGTKVRIIVRLVDRRADGEIVWAARFDRTMTDALTLQDELGAAIVAQVDPELMRHEGRRSATSRSDETTAQGLLLQALPAVYRLEHDSFVDARRLLEASLRADPASSVAHGWLAYWYLLYVGQGWSANPGAASAEAARLAERAVMLDPGDARALTLAGHVRGFLGKHPEEARALHERAISLNPNLALAWCFSGLSHFYLGRHDEALRRINQAIRLSPSDPHVFFFDMALIMPHLMRGDYASAVDAGRRAIELNPLFSSAYKGYLAALGLLDRTREAAEVRRRLMELEPGFSVQEAVLRSPLSCPGDIARYAEGLRRAGLQEKGIQVTAPPPVLLIEHSPIDLVGEAPHSPAASRDDPLRMGRLRNDTAW